MDGQGLQALRSEIEAIITFQSALNRLALVADESALTEWGGPRPDEVDALARDDGTFERTEIIELRKRAGEALATRFREVERVTKDRAELRALLGRALSLGTGGVANLDGPEAGGILAALTRTGAIRLDWAEAAAAMVRDELEKRAAPRQAAPPLPSASAPKPRRRTTKEVSAAPKAKAKAKRTTRATKATASGARSSGRPQRSASASKTTRKRPAPKKAAKASKKAPPRRTKR